MVWGDSSHRVAEHGRGRLRFGDRARLLLITGLGVALVAAIALVAVVRRLAPEPAAPDGAPLLVTAPADRHSSYYLEILRTEGFGSVRSLPASELTGDALDAASVVLLAASGLEPDQVAALTRWVTDGGSLIAFRPDAALVALFGLTPAFGTLADAYLRIDTSRSPGAGITGQTLQFHGPADLHRALSGTRVVAELYRDAATAAGAPAVTVRTVGAGHAAAFSFDLALSVIRTRQGNPAWAGQNRDGVDPIAANDLFAGGGQPDYVDLNKVAIPQADEQQRLLANLIGELTAQRWVLPRIWYLPKGAKAAILLVADDHALADKTRAAVAYQLAQSRPGCSVADWECVRSTTLMYTRGSPRTNYLVDYSAQGFDFGVHVSTDCGPWTPDSLRRTYADALGSWGARHFNLMGQVVNRLHCVSWTDYVSAAKIGREFGLRLDMNYYYWPQEWAQNRPGYFTGSGIPMRFTDSDGSTLDVYQAPTQLANETHLDWPESIDIMLQRAVGPEGYFGVLGTHYDYVDDFDKQLIAAAQKWDVPVISGAQLTEWLDARNASEFTPAAWQGDTLRFTARIDPGARQLLRGMLPLHTSRGVLNSLTLDGAPASFTVETIKGVDYALFTATSGTVEARYTAD